MLACTREIPYDVVKTQCYKPAMVLGRKRETETERQRDKETERQRERQRQRQTERQRDRDRERERERDSMYISKPYTTLIELCCF